MGEAMWWLISIVLPAVLLVGLIWIVFQRRSNKTDRRTEAGTRGGYEDEEKRRREGTDGL